MEDEGACCPFSDNTYSLGLIHEKNQGWEFAHLISERIARFLYKNEQMSDSLKKMSDSLLRSFLVSKMSDSLTSLISSERPEQMAHGCSFLVSEMSDSLTLLTKKEEMSKNERFAHFSIFFLNLE